MDWEKLDLLFAPQASLSHRNACGVGKYFFGLSGLSKQKFVKLWIEFFGIIYHHSMTAF